MKSLSVRIKSIKNVIYAIEHDGRLFENSPKPSYINYEKTHKNFFLYVRNDFPQNKSEVKKWIEKIEKENKEIFQKLKEKNLIAKNQGYKIKQPIIQGILTLSYEAQTEIKDIKKQEIFFAKAKEYLLDLAEKLGTELLYAVVHLDETAPHIHFCFRNLRVKEGKLTNSRSIGKSLSSSFFIPTKNATKVRDYIIPYSQIQDTLDFFNDIGFSRGKRKIDRERDGEDPNTYVAIAKSVKELHETLPLELEKKRKELEEMNRKYQEWRAKYVEEYRKLQERKKELEQELIQREQLLRSKTNELTQKEQELIQREQLLRSKTNELTQKEQELIQREQLLRSKTREISQEEERIRKKTEEITTQKEFLEKANILLEQKNQKLLSEVEQRQKELAEIKQLQNNYQTLQRSYQELKLKYDNLRTEYKTLIFQYNFSIDLISQIREKAEKKVKELPKKSLDIDMS